MLYLYDDLCCILCTVLHGRYYAIQHSWCNTNETIIKQLCLPPMRLSTNEMNRTCQSWSLFTDPGTIES